MASSFSSLEVRRAILLSPTGTLSHEVLKFRKLGGSVQIIFVMTCIGVTGAPTSSNCVAMSSISIDVYNTISSLKKRLEQIVELDHQNHIEIERSRHGGRRLSKREEVSCLKHFSAHRYKKHPQSDTEEEDDQAQKSTHRHASSKLHNLTLIPFIDYLAWPKFWDRFEADFLSDKSLSEVSKFNYLGAQLDREAASTISGFRLSM